MLEKILIFVSGLITGILIPIIYHNCSGTSVLKWYLAGCFLNFLFMAYSVYLHCQKTKKEFKKREERAAIQNKEFNEKLSKLYFKKFNYLGFVVTTLSSWIGFVWLSKLLSVYLYEKFQNVKTNEYDV